MPHRPTVLIFLCFVLLSTISFARTFVPVALGAGNDLKANINPTWIYPGKTCEQSTEKITFKTGRETCSYPFKDRGRVYSCKGTELRCLGSLCPSRACRVSGRLPTTFVAPTPLPQRKAAPIREAHMVKLPGSIAPPKPAPSYKN